MKNISASSGFKYASSSSMENVPSKAENIAWCSVFVLEAVFIVLGNLLTILLFAVNKKLRKKSLFLVMNMAFADLIFGAVFFPNSVIHQYQLLWTTNRQWYMFSNIQTVSLKVSLISAALISCERFYAIYWPLKHRTLTMRVYRTVIFMAWALAVLDYIAFLCVANLSPSSNLLISTSITQITYVLILLFIVCGCNIGIWRKLQHGNIASQRQNRASQNQRLTKTLLFVSILALLSWLPFITVFHLFFIFDVSPTPWHTRIVFVLLYSNSFLNPVVYALRIPELRQALGSCCFRRQAATDKDVYGRDNRVVALTPATQLRTLPTDPRHLQLSYEQQVMDTKL